MAILTFDLRRAFALVSALLLMASALAIAPARAFDGVPPEIVSLVDVDLDIDPQEKRALELVVTGVDDGATFEFSGTGLDVTGYKLKSGGVARLHLLASVDAEAGLRDLTVTNPDGLSATYPDAMLVTGDTVPPDLGDLTVHVFEDIDGNGIEDGGETGLAGVSVDIVDLSGGGYNVVTDGSGDATLLDVPVGDATLSYVTPTAMALTTANDVQVVTVVVGTSAAAGSVGYQVVPTGDVGGRVFTDLDGNGIEDGADTGLGGVAVTVTDINGVGYDVVTDGSGDYSVTQLPLGDADVTYTGPAGYTLTTANDTQVVTVVDGTSAAAGSVGYQVVPTGDVGGRVFTDLDGNGIEDGADTGLGGVAVTVTDINGVGYDVVTDGSGDYSVTLVTLGDADIAYTGPAGYTLTTANDTQVVTVTDGGLASASVVGYQPPSADSPQIIGMQDASPVIDPGQKKHFNLDVLNFIDGATVSFSGTGLTVKTKITDSDTIKISIIASDTAEVGPRDLTVTNPGGGSDTLVGALTVGGVIMPPISGDVSGRVFEDVDGNGIEDGTDTGLANVGVSFVDAAGDTWPGMTDGNGDFIVAVGVGEGTLTVSGSAGATLTTANKIQVLTITEGLETIASAVGYLPPSGDTAFVNVALAGGIVTDHNTAGACAPAIGVGSAWADVDGDGDQDLFTTNRTGVNRLYRNDGDTNSDGITDFTDVAAALGIDAASEDSFGTVFIDYDNDGDQDLFVANSSGNTLWQNQLDTGGSLSFVDVSGSAGLDDAGRIQTATWGDIDNDGFLDVYYAKHATCAAGGTTTDRLFRNNGDGTFSDWTSYLCPGGVVPCDDVDGLGFAAAMFDYDNDGDTDIYLVNDVLAGAQPPNKLWRNDGPDGSGGWLFVEDSAAANLDFAVNGMGLDIGDYNNDGFLDLAFSDSGPGHLLMNDGDGTFTDVSSSSGVTAGLAGGVSWGTAFLDYNNDGWQDLFFAQGSIGTASPLASAFLENDGDGTFTNVTDVTGMGDEARARNVTTVDFNADGWVDVFVGNYDDYPLLMQNKSADNGNTNEWLTITVEGTVSNRDAIGAVITVTTGAGTQSQLISSGGNHGGGSQKAAFFGLGSATSATVSIAWPNGVVQNLGSVNSAQAVHFVEPTS